MFREVARKKQALTSEQIIEILKAEKRGVLSVCGDNGYPYGLPINFWYNEENGYIYFHSGKKGHKTDAVMLCLLTENMINPKEKVTLNRV